MHDPDKPAALQYLTLQFLDWLAESPRSYAEVMDAWRTSCPRLSVWEDACIDGLVERSGATVSLTPSGRAALAARQRDLRLAAE
jgi:hypothetical protein